MDHNRMENHRQITDTINCEGKRSGLASCAIYTCAFNASCFITGTLLSVQGLGANNKRRKCITKQTNKK